MQTNMPTTTMQAFKAAMSLTPLQISNVISGLEKARDQQVKKEENAIEIANKIKESGLTLEDIEAVMVGKSNKQKKERKPVEKNFIFTDKEGNTHEWSGRGRMPVVFRQHIDENKIKKEDLRIK